MSRNLSHRSAKPIGALAALLVGTTALSGAPAHAGTTEAGPAPFDVAEIVAKAAPSIVAVEASGAAGQAMVRLPTDAFLEHLAQRFGTPFPAWPLHSATAGANLATGIVVSEDGRILTRADAVEDASLVRVTLADGQQLDATVVGVDEMTDLAVLKIEATGLSPLAFAADTRTGEPVIALGAKFGDRREVSSGIVSGTGEDVQQAAIFDALETDAAISWGNSGGPLLNGQGEIVGVNARHVRTDGMSPGLNVAVPADVASEVLADLSADGKVERGFLGVQITPVSDDVAAALGLEANTGAFVEDVSEGSPAAAAGLKRGDIVLSVNGADIRTPRDLTRSIANDRPGAEVAIQLLRAGQPTTLNATLGSRSA
jgi:serine protease Do